MDFKTSKLYKKFFSLKTRTKFEKYFATFKQFLPINSEIVRGGVHQLYKLEPGPLKSNTLFKEHSYFFKLEGQEIILVDAKMAQTLKTYLGDSFALVQIQLIYLNNNKNFYARLATSQALSELIHIINEKMKAGYTLKDPIIYLGQNPDSNVEKIVISLTRKFTSISDLDLKIKKTPKDTDTYISIQNGEATYYKVKN